MKIRDFLGEFSWIHRVKLHDISNFQSIDPIFNLPYSKDIPALKFVFKTLSKKFNFLLILKLFLNFTFSLAFLLFGNSFN